MSLMVSSVAYSFAQELSTAKRPDGSASLVAGRGGVFETHVLTKAEQLANLAPEWSRLWERELSATPFQAPEWLLPWWRYLGESQLRVVTVRQAQPVGLRPELVGLLPLYTVNASRAGPGKLLPLGVGTSDYLGALFAPGTAERALPLALRALLEQDPNWSSIEFPNLRPDSPLLHAPLPAGLRREAFLSEPTLVLPLPQGGAASVSAVLPKSLVQNLAYYRRRAERHGRVEFVSATPANLEELWSDLLRLHQARWGGRHQSGVLAQATVQRAHREALPGLLARGLLRLYGLRLAGRTCAVFYGLGDRRHGCERAYYYLGGMDPQLARLSPGSLLIAHALESALSEGAQHFDFLRGQEQYKSLWGAVAQVTCGVRLERL